LGVCILSLILTIQRQVRIDAIIIFAIIFAIIAAAIIIGVSSSARTLHLYASASTYLSEVVKATKHLEELLISNIMHFLRIR
jgi:hypothetical protein